MTLSAYRLVPSISLVSVPMGLILPDKQMLKQNRKRCCFPRSLSAGSGGTTGLTMKEKADGRSEDGNWGKARVNGLAFTCWRLFWCCVWVCFLSASGLETVQKRAFRTWLIQPGSSAVSGSHVAIVAPTVLPQGNARGGIRKVVLFLSW